MRALTYEWGSKNHLVKMKSTESPDESAFRQASDSKWGIGFLWQTARSFGKLGVQMQYQVGESIREAAGKTSKNRWFYPLGPINDLAPRKDSKLQNLGADAPLRFK